MRTSHPRRSRRRSPQRSRRRSRAQSQRRKMRSLSKRRRYRGRTKYPPVPDPVGKLDHTSQEIRETLEIETRQQRFQEEKKRKESEESEESEALKITADEEVVDELTADKSLADRVYNKLRQNGPRSLEQLTESFPESKMLRDALRTLVEENRVFETGGVYQHIVAPMQVDVTIKNDSTGRNRNPKAGEHQSLRQETASIIADGREEGWMERLYRFLPVPRRGMMTSATDRRGVTSHWPGISTHEA